MYFWKIDDLKEDIKAERLTEKDRFVYAVIYLVLGAIAVEVMMAMPLETVGIWDLVSSSSNVLIVLFGTIFAFKANGANNGTDFLGKYLSIGFVMAIRFMVYAVPLLVVLFLYYFMISGEEEAVPAGPIDVIPFMMWHAAMYWRIYVHIKQVNS